MLFLIFVGFSKQQFHSSVLFVLFGLKVGNKLIVIKLSFSVVVNQIDIADR